MTEAPKKNLIVARCYHREQVSNMELYRHSEGNRENFLDYVAQQGDRQLHRYMEENVDSDCLNCEHRLIKRHRREVIDKDAVEILAEARCESRVCKKELTYRPMDDTFDISGNPYETFRVARVTEDNNLDAVEGMEIKEEDLELW